MPTVLRYAKVKEIDKTHVALIGVNPPTGKHVKIALEIADSEALRRLDYACLSHLFKVNAEGTGTVKARTDGAGNSIIQVQLDGKVGPRIEFSEEKPPAEREDSYFTLLSYCCRKNYNPLLLRELDHKLVVMDDVSKPVKKIGTFLLNMTDKLGNLLYAGDQVDVICKSNAWNKTDPFYQEIRYHVVAAVSSCKSCFDALAAIVNETYGLGFSKGKLDLATRRSNLLNELGKVNTRLSSHLKGFEKWINEITDYRDFVEHRIMLIAPPVSNIDNKTETLGPLICMVPKSPLTYGDVPSKPVILMSATDFCLSLVEKLEELILVIIEDLLHMIRSKKYIP